MLSQAAARDPDRFRELARLAQLLGKLREEPGARLALEPPLELIDAGDVLGHDPLARPGVPGPPLSRVGARGEHYASTTRTAHQRGSTSPRAGRHPSRYAAGLYRCVMKTTCAMFWFESKLYGLAATTTWLSVSVPAV